MQIIKGRGAQNEIWSSPENKQAPLEVGRKGKGTVQRRVGAAFKTKQKPTIALETSADSKLLQFTHHYLYSSQSLIICL